MSKYLAIAATVLFAAVALTWWGTSRTDPAASPATEADIAAGAQLYADNCASCHGANLEGQPDWRTPNEDGSLPAPPHDETGHTWHHGDGVLFDYTKLGGKAALARQGVELNSGMPGFGDMLSDQQIRDTLSYIKSTWPARQREVQAARSEAEHLQGETTQ